MIKNIKVKKELLVSQVDGNIVSDMDGEKVMLSIHNGKYYNLGDIGGDIWDSIHEPVTIENLINKLHMQYDVRFEVCEEHVMNFLTQLHNEGLVKLED